MQLFYTPDVRGDFAYFQEDEARHIVQVLRRKVGDQLCFVDGQGGYYEGNIQETGKKTCVLGIHKAIKPYNERSFSLKMAIAPTKNINRFEWFLEKATEIGVEEIYPILCKHSERKNIRIDRLNKVLIAAMKQSLKAFVPKLHPLQSFSEVLEQNREAKQQYIAHCHRPITESLAAKYQPGKDVVIWIGPEGDFSKPEVGQAIEAGCEEVNLGRSRLRTETAGIVACHTIAIKNEV